MRRIKRTVRNDGKCVGACVGVDSPERWGSSCAGALAVDEERN
jgi:hypothetical protein